MSFSHTPTNRCLMTEQQDPFKEIIERNKKRLKLVIATPFYEVKGYSPYISCLIQSTKALTEMGITWDYYELSGDSYVDRAKNTLAHRFMEQSDFTHMMMIDSDMSWELSGFLRIIKAVLVGFELVGAAYPCKNVWHFFGCIPKVDPEDQSFQIAQAGDVQLIDMYALPGGFVVYSRKCFEQVKPNVKTYIDPNDGTVFHEYFRCNVEDGGGRVGEDVYFQLRYKETGGRVWLEPDVTIQHWGVKAWTGNYKRHLYEGEESSEYEGNTWVKKQCE